MSLYRVQVSFPLHNEWICRMGLILFAILLTLQIIEIMVFVQAGDVIGWLNVIVLTVLTALAGTAIIRWQGFQAIATLQSSMAAGQTPVAPVVDGIFLLVAAPLMMTPGFITDGLGFLMLVPPVRHAVARVALKRLKRAMENGDVTIMRP